MLRISRNYVQPTIFLSCVFLLSLLNSWKLPRKIHSNLQRSTTNRCDIMPPWAISLSQVALMLCRGQMSQHLKNPHSKCKKQTKRRRGEYAKNTTVKWEENNITLERKICCWFWQLKLAALKKKTGAGRAKAWQTLEVATHSKEEKQAKSARDMAHFLLYFIIVYIFVFVWLRLWLWLRLRFLLGSHSTRSYPYGIKVEIHTYKCHTYRIIRHVFALTWRTLLLPVLCSLLSYPHTQHIQIVNKIMLWAKAKNKKKHRLQFYFFIHCLPPRADFAWFSSSFFAMFVACFQCFHFGYSTLLHCVAGEYYDMLHSCA